MKNKQFCWSHAYGTHFAARRRLAARGVGMRLPASGAIAYSSLLVGRIVVVVAIMTFIGSYLYGINHYGWGLGIAVGWLPSITLAWLAAQMLAFIVRSVRNKEIAMSQSLLRFNSVHSPSCCRTRTNSVLHYWRRDKQASKTRCIY